MWFLLDWCSRGCTSRDGWVYSSDDSDWPPAGNRQDSIRASVKIPDRCQLLPSGCISTAVGDSVPLLQVSPLMISSVETVVFLLLVFFVYLCSLSCFFFFGIAVCALICCHWPWWRKISISVRLLSKFFLTFLKLSPVLVLKQFSGESCCWMTFRPLHP